MDLNLGGKAALVTGASRGIGASIAQELAREGVQVCLAARDKAKLEDVATSIAAISGSNRTTVIAGDLREPAAVKAAVDAAVCGIRPARHPGEQRRRHQTCRLLHADRGRLAGRLRAEIPRLCTRHARRLAASARTAAAASSTSSASARASGSAEFTIGGSVNVALLNFTKAMADIGVNDGVRVNAINPGLIETERFGRNIERVSRDHGFNREQAIAFLLSSHGTTRVGRPEEIGWLTAYLASEKADFIQGCVIDIDGGATRSL